MVTPKHRFSYDALMRNRAGALQARNEPTIVEEVGELTEQEVAQIFEARGGRLCDCFSAAGEACTVHTEMFIKHHELKTVLEAREAACEHLFGIERPAGWGDW